jgi:hypothetical protein
MVVCTDYKHPMKAFFIEIPNFWAWANKFKIWGIWGYFRLIYQHPLLSIFSINEPLFLKKKLSICIQNIIWDWDLNLGRKEFGI